MSCVKLKDITTCITDGKHGDCKGQDNSGYFFVSCKDVFDGVIHYENSRQITKDDFVDADRRTNLMPNDILITNSGTIGRMALVKDIPETRKTTFQKSVAIVKPNTDKVLPVYLYYLLQSKVNDFINSSNGAAQKNLLLSTMRDFDLEIEDSLPTQHRIATILSRYDSLIENYQKQIKLMEEASQRLHKEWFVDLRFPGHENTKIVDGVPEGWEKKKVTDILEIKYGKDHKPLKDGNIPVYGTGGAMRYVDKSLYTGESVLIPRKGSLNNIMYVNETFWTIDTMFYSIPKIENAAKIVLFYLRSLDMYSMNIGAAVPSMTVNILSGIDVLLPSNEIRQSFEEALIPYFSSKRILSSQIRLLTEARDRLLPKLMSGEIAV